MISDVIDLTLALSKAGEKAVLVTSDNSVIETLKEHGKEIALKTGVKHLRVQKENPIGVRKNFSVNYEGVEKDYGDKAVVIIGKISTLSYESIKNNTKEGVFRLMVDGEECSIKEEFLKEELATPAGSKMFDFGKGYVYVEPESDLELEQDVEKEVQEDEKEAEKDMPKPEPEEDSLPEEDDLGEELD